MLKKILLVKVLCFAFLLGGSAKVRILNITDFGAKGNGITDDTYSIQNCLNTAAKEFDVKIVVPYGTYKISKALIFDFLEGTKEVYGEQKNNANPVFISSSKTDIFVARGYLFDKSASTFKIKNLNLVGQNIPYSNTHPKINKKEWFGALVIYDKREAYIDNVVIQNFYGQGIFIGDTKQEGIPVTACFQFVSISNSKIIDVWGHNPKDDNYGDAIYMSNVRSGALSNNYIKNNLSNTRQLGRAGIVIEYMCQNINIQNNTIVEGYDRPLHIEETDGGHHIKNNTLLGSDLGLIIAEANKRKDYKEVIIYNNYVSNTNLVKFKSIKKSFARDHYGDRALVYIDTKHFNNNVLIKIEKNKFEIDGNYEYDSNVILNNRSDNVELSSNTFQVIHSKKKFSLANFSKKNLGVDWNKSVLNK